ncbi:MAG: hypothetical protein KC736_00915 [Candidatus Moranbacteria bacterium]|nr:hypothetical protein [Candidatus Moranbacteria bacterium]
MSEFSELILIRFPLYRSWREKRGGLAPKNAVDMGVLSLIGTHGSTISTAFEKFLHEHPDESVSDLDFSELKQSLSGSSLTVDVLSPLAQSLYDVMCTAVSSSTDKDRQVA